MGGWRGAPQGTPQLWGVGAEPPQINSSANEVSQGGKQGGAGAPPSERSEGSFPPANIVSGKLLISRGD